MIRQLARSVAWKIALACVLGGSTVTLSPARLGAQDSEGAIAAHPDELRFPELRFDAPRRSDHRHVLANGVVVYVVEDRSLPLVTVSAVIRAGGYLDPAGKEGLLGALGSQMRAGGTDSLAPEELDEEVDFLAAELETSIGDSSGSAAMDCLTKDLDRVLGLLFDVLRRPRFDGERLELWRKSALQDISRRNDSTASIEAREWNRLLRGDGDFQGARVTKASVESIGRQDLIDAHRRHIHPRNLILAVSGDVATEDILARLEKLFEGWSAPPVDVEGENHVPPPGAAAAPGVYLVAKDVNQGRVSIGHPGVRRDHPDYHALVVMNQILGGGGFASRIVGRVRSDEGLAYTARSEYDFGTWHRGEFRAYFQSKSASVAQAAAIVVEELERIRSQPVSDEELGTAVSYLVNVFPRFFASPSTVATTFAADELTGRPEEFWTTYRERIAAVTVGDVQRVAREHLRPAELIVLVVGDTEEILEGNPDRPEYSVDKLVPGRPLRSIPLPDPETLVYPEG